MSDHQERLRFYFNALNAFDLKSVEALFAEDAVYTSTGLGTSINGRAKIMEAFRNYFPEFDDQISYDKNLALVSPNTHHSNWALVATSNKTGERINRSGTQITKFNSKGLIVAIQVQDRTRK